MNTSLRNGTSSIVNSNTIYYSRVIYDTIYNDTFPGIEIFDTIHVLTQIAAQSTSSETIMIDHDRQNDRL